MADQPHTPEPAVQDHARHASYLLLGGGLAAATAAETLRQEGAQGAIVIVADERDSLITGRSSRPASWRATPRRRWRRCCRLNTFTTMA